MGDAGSCPTPNRHNPGYLTTNFELPCSSSALTRHRHGAGVKNPKEVFLVTLVRKDHCVSMTHATLGKRAHFGEAALKTLRLTS